jgi:hypothetical protein
MLSGLTVRFFVTKRSSFPRATNTEYGLVVSQTQFVQLRLASGVPVRFNDDFSACWPLVMVL